MYCLKAAAEKADVCPIGPAKALAESLASATIQLDAFKLQDALHSMVLEKVNCPQTLPCLTGQSPS